MDSVTYFKIYVSFELVPKLPKFIQLLKKMYWNLDTIEIDLKDDTNGINVIVIFDLHMLLETTSMFCITFCLFRWANLKVLFST